MPHEHTLHVGTGILELYRTKQKWLEVRRNFTRFRSVRPGDTFVINNRLELTRRVLAVRSYDSYTAMLMAEDCKGIHPTEPRSEMLEWLHQVMPLDGMKVLVFELSRD
jgi:ASC-1-like (ASCH) protein